MRCKNSRLAIEAKNRSVHIRLLCENADVVRQVARGKIIRAVDHNIVTGDNLERVLTRKLALMRFDFDRRVHVLQSVAAAVIGGTSILGGRGGFGGTIVGALILTVLTALLTILGLPEPSRQILFGAIIVAVAAAYTRVTGET